MKGRSALPRAAFLFGALAVVVGGAAATRGRDLLARVPAFRVKDIEVVGTRLTAPDSVLGLARISRGASVWEDFRPVETRLRGHALIEEARVHRAGLSTVRIVVTEVEPLALVGVPELRPVRDDGRLLPIDPRASSLDLPVLTTAAKVDSSSTRLSDGPAIAALRVFAALHKADPGLAALVSDFEVAAAGGVMAHLIDSQPARMIGLPAELDETGAARIRATLADLRRRGIEASLLEARYAGQIVVRVDELTKRDRLAGKNGRQL